MNKVMIKFYKKRILQLVNDLIIGKDNLQTTKFYINLYLQKIYTLKENK